MEDQKYKKINIFITGAAGYIGSLLIKELLKKDFIENIIALDREDLPQDIKSEKIKFIKANTVNEDWRREARAYNPDIVIHLAWQIREMWKEKKKQWKWNVDGSLNVFDFAFSMPSVKKLIYTSTASVYGAFFKSI